MTDQLQYRAKINAKGLDNTGVTEDHARDMAKRLGSHHLLIIDARAAKVVIDEEGNQQVILIIGQVEHVPAEHDDTVREFMRSLYRARPEIQGQEVLKGTAGDGLTVADAARGIAAATPEPTVEEPPAQVEGEWDGNTDGPLPALPDDAYPDDATAIPAQEEATSDDDTPWPGDAGYVEPAGSVVQFSGKQKQG